jgi:uncharacterized protein (DUF983 family)
MKYLAHCLECEHDFRTKKSADLHVEFTGHIVQEVAAS